MKSEIHGNIIDIYGNIKSLDDVYTLKANIESINSKNIVINIYDSIAITSTLIGFLRKKINDGIVIHMNIGNKKLYEILDDLGLIEIFNVRKI